MGDEQERIAGITAENAINEGTLIQIEKEFTREIGFKWPVRMTRGVYDLITPSPEASAHGQQFEQRLRDLLTVALVAVHQSAQQTMVEFQVFLWDSPEKQHRQKLHATLDTTNEPAIHLLLPQEY